MKIIYIIADSLLWLLSFPLEWFGLKLPKHPIVSVLAILFLFALISLLIFAYKFVRRLLNENIVQSLNSKNLLKKTTIKIRHPDGSIHLKDSFVYPRIKRKDKYIEIYPINSGIEESEFKEMLQYFSELLRVHPKFIDAKKEHKFNIWKLQKYDSLKLYKENLPKEFKLEQVANKDKYNLCLGINPFLQEKFWDLKTLSAALITGQPGSGKSVLMDSLIKQFILNFPKATVHLASSKNPRMDFRQLTNYPSIHLYQHLHKDQLQSFHDVISNLINIHVPEVESKLISSETTEWYKAKDINPILVILDECFILAGKDNKVFFQDFAKLISLGRAFGIYVIAGTQGQKVSDFTEIGLKPDLFALRIGSATKTAELSDSLYGDREIGCDDNLKRGRMIAYINNKAEIIRAVYAEHFKLNNNLNIPKEIITPAPEVPSEGTSKHLTAEPEAMLLNPQIQAAPAESKNEELSALPFTIINSTPDIKNPQRSKYDIEFENQSMSIYASTNAPNSELIAIFLKKASK